MCEVSPFNLLVGVTGSVAAIKLPELVQQLLQLNSDLPHVYDFQVRVVCTERAFEFVDTDAWPHGVEVLRDADEWVWRGRGDAVLHVELARWAHALLLAPLSANTLAKLAAGLCDNLLTCVARAWHADKPRLYAPAMNTHMWLHPLTAPHRAALAAQGYEELPVATKMLACGDVGPGGMAELPDILQRLRVLHPPNHLQLQHA